MGLDTASKTGWALYDTDKPPSAIISQSFKYKGDLPFDKIVEVRMTIPKLIREQRPDFVAIESPFMFMPRFKKKTAAPGFLAGVDAGTEEETTVNPRTISMLGQIFGACVMAVIGQNVPCCEVAPKTWQTVIPKTIHGDSKQRVAQFLHALNIVSPNMDSRDACLIAVWAAGHSQELKLLERAKQGEPA